ncbi:MAG TPA: hypothetical protein VN522_01310, partial [Solirubrobacterales bacterium]|nr:hypothetical protein [Solirubrobacterales bacterium]
AVNALGAEGRGEGRTFNTFGPPLIETEISIARTRSATVKARINPSGSDTTCEVEYVDAARFEAGGYAGATKIPCPEALPAGFSGRTASVELTGLTIGTAYHYRFVAHNGATTNAGTTVGADQVFSTFGIESFSVETLDREGNPFTQAGGHPYLLKVIIAMTTTATVGTPPPEQVGNLESVSANLRSVRVSLPPGVIGNPMAAPKCDPFLIKPQDCAASTQIGNAFVRSARGTSEEGPVYNLVPPEGVAAQLGTRFNNVGVARIDARVRTGSDYGIDADTLSITADEGVKRVEMSIWGVPADEGHFGERFCPEVGIPGCGSDAPLRPFLANPTSCSGPSAATLSVDSWQEPGSFVSASAPMSAMIRCDRLDFSPTIRIQPETKVADSPTGLHVDLHVPQNENPTGLAEANLRDAVVTLPRGLVINPAGANGLEGCSPGQIELHGPRPARCPDASKIGSVEVDTPLLDHPIEGAVYVAQQGNAGPAHGANPFGSLLAIYIAVDDPQSGVVVKLAGHVEADPQTGQLTTTFSDNPQLPFEHFKLNFFGGPRAALSTPTTCGSYAGAARLTPWSAPEGAAASLADSFQIGAAPAGGPCAGSEAQLGNTPNLEAGTVSPVAGAFSPFVLKLSRPDGSQRLAAIEVTLPKGLVGRLKGIPYCSEAAIQQAQARDQPGDGSLEQAAPSCPAASQVGSVDARAGVGTSPISVAGKAYLGGPYKGAPLSLVIVTPAVAGPFDLGNVVVRSALRVNPETAQITAVSDPLPTILHGIPLDLRSVTVSVDREDFTLNPTNCDPMKVSSAISGTGGGVAHPSSRFQVGSCERLGFKPNLALSLKGGTTRAKNPALKAVLTAPAGQANIRKVQVILPKSVFIDNRHINGPCTRVEFAAGAGNGTECPAKSILGKATAWSPLLEKPLTGKVYFRSNGGERKLPDLVVSLDGQIHVNLVGFIDSVRQKGSQISRTRNTFALVPDAPVSKFVLELQGGKKGLLQNSTNLCKSTNKATVKMDGQNGKVHDFETVVKPRCGHGGRSKK